MLSLLSSGSALEAMKSCDTSMALLTGPYTSLGALMAIVRQLAKPYVNAGGLFLSEGTATSSGC